jgi:hypothetical protein
LEFTKVLMSSRWKDAGHVY